MEISYLNQKFDELEQELIQIEQEQWHKVLRQCYQQFELLNEELKWNFSPLLTHENELLPQDFKRSLNTFLNDMKLGILENPYLMEFVKALATEDGQSYATITLKNTSDRLEQLKYLVGHAYSLDRLNLILRDNPSYLDPFIRHYWKIRKEKNFYRLNNLMGIIKLHSIELPIILFARAWKKKKLRQSFSKFILSFNIFEATMVDLIFGWRENALASLPLILFAPNFKNRIFFWRKFKKGRPAGFSQDGKALEMYSPEPKLWADLYQVWNMAFVSQFPQAPYLLMKLLIPSVSRFQQRPGEYMHTRITALHLAMNYLDSAVHFPKIDIDLSQLGPCSKKLTELWGQVNYSCSQHYLDSVAEN